MHGVRRLVVLVDDVMHVVRTERAAPPRLDTPGANVGPVRDRRGPQPVRRAALLAADRPPASENSVSTPRAT